MLTSGYYIVTINYYLNVYIFILNVGKERKKGSVDWIERIALSFALSIAVVPLAVFYLNLIGVKINLLNSFLTILGIIIISSIIFVWRLRKLKN